METSAVAFSSHLPKSKNQNSTTTPILTPLLNADVLLNLKPCRQLNGSRSQRNKLPPCQCGRGSISYCQLSLQPCIISAVSIDRWHKFWNIFSGLVFQFENSLLALAVCVLLTFLNFGALSLELFKVRGLCIATAIAVVNEPLIVCIRGRRWCWLWQQLRAALSPVTNLGLKIPEFLSNILYYLEIVLFPFKNSSLSP